MCGILACFHNVKGSTEIEKYEELRKLLSNRGPDISSQTTVAFSADWNATLAGYTLWLQGDGATQQPLVDQSGNVLLWNGDAFYKKIANETIPKGKSDNEFLIEKLEAAKTMEEVCLVLESIEGPWSVVYFKKSLNQIITGRDKFGRHSLLWTAKDHDECRQSLIISSVAFSRHFKEIEASHLYAISFRNDCLVIQSCYSRQNYTINNEIHIKGSTEELLNNNCPEKILNHYVSKWGDELKRFEDLLKSAIEERVKCQPTLCKLCVAQYLAEKNSKKCNHSKVAVLFSGGLDSTVLAALTNAVWPNDESIDLLNVAFPLREANSTEELYNIPDRITGLQALEELKRLNPKRKWNFVQINVPLEELQEMRNARIATLINPASTVLDDSIGCAQWFAARGEGYILGSNERYVSPARVILMGAGADEQMGGYARHRKRFIEGGWSALIIELEMEVNRISQRNLGRDNRIIADHGRAPRLPYLDERVVNYLAALPIHVKTDLRYPIGVGDKIVLRALAFSCGLVRTATEPKRAIQFGSRIAKIEARKEKGSFVCDRLAKALPAE